VVAISIQFELNKPLNIPNQKPFKSTDIVNIIQLPTPYLSLGDFYSHSLSWGSDNTDNRGKQIEKILAIDKIMLLNSGEPTQLKNMIFYQNKNNNIYTHLN